MTSDELRSAFLKFFEERGHAIVPSSSLVPANDPTLLFTNAGMVQFKDVFAGIEKRPYTRAATSQKCMRAGGKHNDLENVGPSTRHHTFFEMLGNFSFGDYFKREAILWGWDFLTGVMRLPKDKLWVTIYLDDEEAFQLWQEVAGLPEERIVRLGEKTNFWMMGDTGPCGPCSEIILDRGEESGCGMPTCGVECDCGRYLELWNLVFTQFYQNPDGTRDPLPNPNIDTGMGLERLAAVMQGKGSNYETDLFWPIIQKTQELLGESDADRDAKMVSYRVIADHVRAVAFLIGDGVLPGNEGRSYVLRRILRRAVRHGKILGFDRPFFAEVAQVVIDLMGKTYPELVERGSFIKETISHEEENFQKTLSAGLNRFDAAVEEALAKGERRLTGEDIFRLYDTYGFPLDLTRELAEERGLVLDLDGFQRAMEQQRELSRAAGTFKAGTDALMAVYGDFAGTCVFSGYEDTATDTEILGIAVNGKQVPDIRAGEEGEIVLRVTPFYGESGGQVGDTGYIQSPAGGLFHVSDTQKPVHGVTSHKGKVTEGVLKVGDKVTAQIDVERRMDIARNHTATHLIHRALREVAGTHAQQAGSLVAPDRLRFDFTQLSPLSRDQVEEVERKVNYAIRRNLPLQVEVLALEEARARGAMALFGEKYGAEVRMVEVADFSRELCGGTHVRSTGEIGLVHIVSESSIGSGLRRIEAVSGRSAEEFVRHNLNILDGLAGRFRVPTDQVPEAVEALQERLKAHEREIDSLRAKLAGGELESLLQQVQQVDGVMVLAAQTSAQNPESMRRLGDQIRDKMQSGVIVLGTAASGKPALLAMVTPDLVKNGLHAGKLVKQVAAIIGGGGGGRPDVAEAGGRDASKLDEAISAVPKMVNEALGAKTS